MLRGDITILGKSSECDVQIASSYVSRQHCQISCTGQSLILHDLSSRNGTFVNGQRIRTERVLNNGDELSIGQTSFVLLIGDAAAEAGSNPIRSNTEYMTIIGPLVAMMERGDAIFGGYSTRINKVAELVAKQMGMGAYELENLSAASLLANLGMTRIPREIAYSREPLTREQWAVIRGHPAEAVRTLSGCTIEPSVIAGVAHHHERFDGSGYPDGLLREGIPWAARVIAVAEAITAMTSPRPYRAALDLDAARLEVQMRAATQFDPAAAAAAAEVLSREKDYVKNLLGET